MNKPEIVATITSDFRLKFSIPRLVGNLLQSIGEGKLVRVDIKQWKKPRTQPQNAYLWAVVYPHILKYIQDTTGQKFTVDQLHERYKRKYLGYETCEIPGMEDIIKPRSTTELDSQEFWDDFIEHICREWAELGLFIPLPKKKKEITT